jgi:hypothetical protein
MAVLHTKWNLFFVCDNQIVNIISPDQYMSVKKFQKKKIKNLKVWLYMLCYLLYITIEVINNDIKFLYLLLFLMCVILMYLVHKWFI